MQFGRFFLLMIVIFLSFSPKLALAENLHFEANQTWRGGQFISSDNLFQIKIPSQKYQQPLDVYFYRHPQEQLPADLNALSEVFSYYIYSSAITEESEFTITINYPGGPEKGKTIYYFNSLTQKWAMASNRAFNNNLTFSLKGKENKLVVVGSNLTQTPTQNQEPIKISETFSFAVGEESSQLMFSKICRPYLQNFFKSDKSNPTSEVKKLQLFLKETEGFNDLPISGYYGNVTFGAVKTFQERYSADILQPSGLSKGTGWVLGATLAKINQINCQKNPGSYSYEIILPYETSSKQAKSAYWLNNETWEKLESFDDYKNKTVTAIIEKDLAQVALFQESSQWVGQASWYSWKKGLFAASRDFPKGTKLKVTNQANGKYRGKSVVVEVNDYGPQIQTNRIIDLDKVAFKEIGLLSSGVMPVKIEVLHD
ncbi:MAG: RlpA-like double-psi beta-barrel domain-containing protein [Patescibacteria group bacterium]|jgi:hypothetical protein